MKRNEPYRTTEIMAAKISCEELNVGPAVVTVTFGKTIVRVVNAINTDNAAFAPCS